MTVLNVHSVLWVLSVNSVQLMLWHSAVESFEVACACVYI